MYFIHNTRPFFASVYPTPLISELVLSLLLLLPLSLSLSLLFLPLSFSFQPQLAWQQFFSFSNEDVCALLFFFFSVKLCKDFFASSQISGSIISPTQWSKLAAANALKPIHLIYNSYKNSPKICLMLAP